MMDGSNDTSAHADPVDNFAGQEEEEEERAVSVRWRSW